jgi:hypothetical protein
MKQSRSLAMPDIDPDRVFRARLFLGVDLVAGLEDSGDARQHHRWARRLISFQVDVVGHVLENGPKHWCKSMRPDRTGEAEGLDRHTGQDL